MNEDILVTRDLTKKISKSLAIDHVSLSVKSGEIYGLIGETGAGKTTFIRMVCGLMKPTAGTLELYGASSKTALQKNRKNIGSLIEHPAVYPNMSALENLQIQRRYLGKIKKLPNNTPDKLLELVGLGGAAKKKVREFSPEMKQRLGLAIALAGDPNFLVLDEPSLNLDSADKEEIRNLLRKLNREKGLTIFFSSRDLSEMQHLATRYGILDKGKLTKELTAEELG